MHPTLPLLDRTSFPALQRRSVETLQVNLGYRCNQSCVHCHVNAGPQRTEEMARETIDAVLRFIESSPEVKVLDLTGGAPELNRHFRDLVVAGRQRGLRVIDRCNLTILEEAGHEDLADFLAAQRVEVVGSLPCYFEENVDRQRGRGTFAASLRGLRRLNSLGYGSPASGLLLNLVYNPQGPVLPPPQGPLAAAYRSHLGSLGIVFNELFTLANMPIQRFGSLLVSRGEFDAYLQLLRLAHRDENVDRVMCRDLLSVDWQGFLYDCDFNQQLGLPMTRRGGRRLHIGEASAALLAGRPIVVAGHCFGCTAGQGSSCGGALGTDDTVAPAHPVVDLVAG